MPSKEVKTALRSMVRGAYDLQKLRISMGNRVIGAWKANRGQQPGKREESEHGGMSKKDQEILKNLRKEYKVMADGIKVFNKEKFVPGKIITHWTEFCLMREYEQLRKAEEAEFRRFESSGILDEYLVYVKFFKPFKGIGGTLAGVFLSEIDIEKADSVSALWKYAGLDCVEVKYKDENGVERTRYEGRCRKEHHQVPKKYTDTDGKVKETTGISFKPFLKTKVVGVLPDCLFRSKNEKYQNLYKLKLAELEVHPVWGKHNDKEKPTNAEKKDYYYTSPGRRRNQARRYIAKIFLQELWVAWRICEGLPIRPSYHEAKQGGHDHNADLKKAMTGEKTNTAERAMKEEKTISR